MAGSVYPTFFPSIVPACVDDDLLAGIADHPARLQQARELISVIWVHASAILPAITVADLDGSGLGLQPLGQQRERLGMRRATPSGELRPVPFQARSHGTPAERHVSAELLDVAAAALCKAIIALSKADGLGTCG